jgi:hypothetical protein
MGHARAPRPPGAGTAVAARGRLNGATIRRTAATSTLSAARSRPPSGSQARVERNGGGRFHARERGLRAEPGRDVAAGHRRITSAPTPHRSRWRRGRHCRQARLQRAWRQLRRIGQRAERWCYGCDQQHRRRHTKGYRDLPPHGQQAALWTALCARRRFRRSTWRSWRRTGRSSPRWTSGFRAHARMRPPPRPQSHEPIVRLRSSHPLDHHLRNCPPPRLAPAPVTALASTGPRAPWRYRAAAG